MSAMMERERGERREEEGERNTCLPGKPPYLTALPSHFMPPSDAFAIHYIFLYYH